VHLNKDLYSELDDFLENQRMSRVSHRNIEMPRKNQDIVKEKKVRFKFVEM